MITHSFLHRHSIGALLLIPCFLWMSASAPHFTDTPHDIMAVHYTPQFFKWMTVGQWPAAVEGMWISLIQKIGQNQITDQEREEILHFYDLATDLDPLFYELYDEAGVCFSFTPGGATDAIHFLEKGIRTYQEQVRTDLFSQSFRDRFWFHPTTLYIYLAYTQAYELQNWKAARATFLAASEISGAPHYLVQMKSWLKEEGSERILGVKVLHLLIANSTDDSLKRKYQEKLNQLEGQK